MYEPKNDFYPVARSDELFVGKLIAATLLETQVLLWRSKSGEVHAWRDQCPHRGARLSLGIYDATRDAVQCPYHGWRYGPKGKCEFVPAHPSSEPPTRVVAEAFGVQEAYGYVWVALGPEPRPIPELSHFADDNFRVIPCGPYDYKATGTRAIENFLDMAHFPYVHAPYLGSEPHTEVLDYDVSLSSDRRSLSATNCRFYQPSNNVSADGGYMSYSYRVSAPLLATLTKDPEGDDPRVEAIMLAIQPLSEFESRGWISLAINYDHDVPDSKFQEFQDTITLQDLPVVESQVPKALPLLLKDEFHQKCDQLSVAYRRWLASLAYRYGTIMEE